MINLVDDDKVAVDHARQLVAFGSSSGRKYMYTTRSGVLLLADNMTMKGGERGDREQLNASGKLVSALSLCAHTIVQQTGHPQEVSLAQLWL